MSLQSIQRDYLHHRRSGQQSSQVLLPRRLLVQK
ncbi:unnamed protein product, partial [Rotaria sp. Silwood1]